MLYISLKFNLTAENNKRLFLIKSTTVLSNKVHILLQINLEAKWQA